MSEANKELLRRWFEEVWNKKRTEAIDEMFDAEGIVYGLNDDPTHIMRGPEAFKPFHAKFCGAFPDIEVVVEDIIAEGDKIAARCSVRGQHHGDDLGIAASRAPIDFTGMVFVTIKDGKFVEAWNNFDFLLLNRQIGAL
jgi:steroid delta-isomerase-like uncharacterized protein